MESVTTKIGSLPDADADRGRFGVERRKIHRFYRNAGKDAANLRPK